MQKYYTIPQFAKILNISKASAYRIIKEERMNLISFGPRSNRISESQINSLIKSHSRIF